MDWSENADRATSFMVRNPSIIELGPWLQSPPGRYLLAWEQAEIDRAVSDLFGFHALQLGLAELDALRANRMPHRWVAVDSLREPAPWLAHPPARQALRCDFDALPFPSQSLDLVVLPHTLELARDPHDTLREVERVLMPEGRVVIVGFNPTSLWGLRQGVGHLRQRLGGAGPLYLPSAGEFIAYRRVRDWLRLLGFEVERGRFGLWRPPLRSENGLARLAWLESAGERAWPVLGAVYMVEAVKRVRGMRLVGMRRRKKARQVAPAVVANRVLAGFSSRGDSTDRANPTAPVVPVVPADMGDMAVHAGRTAGPSWPVPGPLPATTVLQTLERDIDD
jgi:SAM-dependent methyltransferase